MKKLALLGCLLSLGSTLSFADATTPPAGHPEGPCKKLADACMAAGYQKGMHKTDGKGLYYDCMDPIMAGKSVAGVTVDPATVSACQENRAKHQAKKAAGGAPTPTTPPAK